MRNLIRGKRASVIRGQKRPNASGYSLVELIVVLTILGIMTAISVPYLIRYSKLYKTEDQAIKVMDLMREAAQLSLNRRRIVRFEIDLTTNAARIVDERGAEPDVIIKSIPLEQVKDVRMDVRPNGVTAPNPPNYAAANFGGIGIWSVKFRSDGSVVNAADLPVSATLYFWPPRTEPLNMGDLVPRQLVEVRALTLFGGSGAVRYWKHNGTTFNAFQ